VTTEDGYVSQMFRIPGKVQEIGQANKKPAVLMMAGWLADHKFWTSNDPDLAPPFTLVDAGYDVWLGNNRGDRYAQAHTTLDKSKQEFWNFHWIDMGLKDTPRFIDFVLEQTGQSKLTYIGHSRGTA
jgi:pimeloyl-ACP methyl ester carboxylesterase